MVYMQGERVDIRFNPAENDLSYLGSPSDVAFQCYRRLEVVAGDVHQVKTTRPSRPTIENRKTAEVKIPSKNLTSPSGESANGREEWIVTVAEQFEFVDDCPFVGLRKVGFEALIVVLAAHFHHDPRIHPLPNEHRLSNVTAEVVRGDYNHVPTDVPGLNSVKSSIRCSSSVTS